MVTVKATGTLRVALDGLEATEVEADTIRQLLTRLADRHPKLADELDNGVAVAINGEIYREDWDVRIPTGAEVFLVPRIQGG